MEAVREACSKLFRKRQAFQTKAFWNGPHSIIRNKFKLKPCFYTASTMIVHRSIKLNDFTRLSHSWVCRYSSMRSKAVIAFPENRSRPSSGNS